MNLIKIFKSISDSTLASQTLSVPEEEEEEEQEEDESVPDLTGFVLEDMKLYVHIVYILSGQLDE